MSNLWDDAFPVSGYDLCKAGLFFLRPDKDGNIEHIQVTDSPFWYHSAYVDLDTGEAQVEIRYVVDSTLKTLLIDRSLFYSQSWLSSLAGQYKLPVPPHAANMLSSYMYRADIACTRIGYTSTHAGWVTLPDGSVEYVPFGSVQPNPVGAGTKKRFSFIKTAGDEKAWYDTVFKTLEENPLAVLPFAGSLAAPLLSLLDVPSVVIDVHNTSSSGKTIACLMAMSIWGKPDQLKINWDTTKIALEQNAIAFSDLPLFFDESQLGYPKDIGVSVYNIANGMGRERGAAGGGTQLTGTWSTVLISTGEQSLLSLIPQNYAGLDARIIPVEGKTLANLNASKAQALSIFVRNNYGFLAPKYIEHLKTINKAHLFQRYEYYTDLIRPFVYPGDAIQMRKAETYATLLVAIEQLYTIVPDYKQEINSLWYAILSFWKDSCARHQGDQVAYNALTVMFDFFNANKGRFRNDDSSDHERYGTVYLGHMAFFPTKLRELFKKNDLPMENVLREFHERGWLHPNSKNKKVRTTVGNTKEQKQFYALSGAALDAYERNHHIEVDDRDDIAIEAWQQAIDAGSPSFEDTLSQEEIDAALKDLDRSDNSSSKLCISRIKSIKEK